MSSVTSSLSFSHSEPLSFFTVKWEGGMCVNLISRS